MDTKKLLAELLGTFTFFLIGLMAIESTVTFGKDPSHVQGADLVVIAFGFGLGLFAAIQAFGAISGGHFNPAVTVAAVLDGRLDPMTGVGYVVSQLIGGIAAAAVVLTMTSQAAVAGTATVPGGGLNDIQALIVETVFTAIFILVILTSTKKTPEPRGLRHPADPDRHPPGDRALHGLLGEPGPVDRLGGHRRQARLAVGVPRRPDPRRGRRLGRLPLRPRGGGPCLSPVRPTAGPRRSVARVRPGAADCALSA